MASKVYTLFFRPYSLIRVVYNIIIIVKLCIRIKVQKTKNITEIVYTIKRTQNCTLKKIIHYYYSCICIVCKQYFEIHVFYLFSDINPIRKKIFQFQNCNCGKVSFNSKMHIQYRKERII